MSDTFGQTIQGLHVEGDSVVTTDQHIGALAKDDSGNYTLLNVDASGNLLVTGSASTEYSVDDAAGATDSGPAVLVVRVDTPSTLTPADGDYTRLQVNDEGYLWVQSTDLDIRNLSGDADTVNLSDGTNTLDIDGSGYLTVNVNGTVTVSATDLDIRDLSASQDNVAISDGTNSLAVNGDGSINVVSSDSSLDSTYEYGSANLVKDTATTVLDIAPGTDERYSGMMVSGAGYCEWDVQFGPEGSEATIMKFWTTPSNPTQFIDFPDYKKVAGATESLQVVATNREQAASPSSDFTGHVSLIKMI